MPSAERPLSAREVEDFIARGFVRLEQAFASALADECRALLWEQLGLSPDRPREWTRPVIRLASQDAPPFRAAMHTPRLFGALDQLVGEGRWVLQEGLGGTVAVRFPVPGDPGDDGWHIDGSFAKDGSWWVNVRSDERSLLMLVLFSDVGEDDAPTRIRVGSHLDVPAVLAPAGDAGMHFGDAVSRVPDIHGRELALAVGAAGEMYLCHPFLVHAADRHRGKTARFIAQPPAFWRSRLDLKAPADTGSPVELAIRMGLEQL
jgi:hypothetical protein